jgi:hypothetical protein
MTVQIEEHDKIKDNHINTTLVGVGDGPMHISHQNVTEKVPSPLGGVGHIRSYNLGPSLGRPDYYINEALAQKKLTPMPTIGLTYIDNLGAGPRMQEIEWTSSPSPSP